MAFPPLSLLNGVVGVGGRPALTWRSLFWAENGMTVRVHGWSCSGACEGIWLLLLHPSFQAGYTTGQPLHTFVGSQPQVLPVLEGSNECVFCAEVPGSFAS